MKKLLNLCLIITSLFGYLEWGQGQQSFLFQTEYELIFGDKGLQNLLHPFVILPLGGQLLLLITLFQKTPSKALTYIGLGCLSLLLVFIAFIGVISFNFKILASTLPFIITGILVIMKYRKEKKERRLAVS